MRHWSLPKDFHTCGKNCGNSTRSALLLSYFGDFASVFAGAKPKRRMKSGFLTGLQR
jgi:hypothetical protein